MLHFIYSQSLSTILLLMALLLVLWGWLGAWVRAVHWRWGNLVLSAVSTALILYATLLSREVGEQEVVLVPFAALAAAREEPELYREMLMNVFLFFPLGLTLVHALPPKWRPWLRIICTTLIGCMLSMGIEYAQYCFALGMAETDDVICNTLGTLLGAASLRLAHIMETDKKGPPT